jgi:ATP phosphoribosyltransferase regulatory subunit
LASLGLPAQHQPTLLVGHHGLLSALLSQVPVEQRSLARHALTDFDPLALAALALPDSQRHRLMALIGLRGEPVRVLYQLEQWLGPVPLLESLAATLASVKSSAAGLGVRVQLDPTFQPHFDLYDGLVFKLVCHGADAPVAIASGGRYDALVGRFCAGSSVAAGTGFGFDVEAIRDLLESVGAAAAAEAQAPGPWLVASATAAGLGQALSRMADLHRGGEAAELCTHPCADQASAEQLAAERGCRGAVWLAA